jgi:hypothetical protein
VPDGICAIGQSHQRKTSLIQRDTSPIAHGPFHYEGQRDGCKVVLDWPPTCGRTPYREPPTSKSRFASRTMAPTFEQTDRTVESFATPLFLAAAARFSAAMERFAPYGACRFDQPYDDSPASTNCITVVRRLPTPRSQTRSRRSS